MTTEEKYENAMDELQRQTERLEALHKEHEDAKEKIDRVRIAQRAIMLYRSKEVTPKKAAWGRGDKFPLTYGCYGLLDWVNTGDLEAIMERTLRVYVARILIMENKGDQLPPELKAELEFLKKHGHLQS
jgi:hypothetical protein